jgi:hypothetical protein
MGLILSGSASLICYLWRWWSLQSTHTTYNNIIYHESTFLWDTESLWTAQTTKI